MGYTSLRGVNNYSQSSLDSQLCLGVQYFFDWGTLNVGGFQNVYRGQGSLYGGNQYRLRAVADDNYLDGQVWETARKNWVWETGLSYGVDPIDISGVWVDNTFHSKDTTGAYQHIINYLDGRIIFDSPISTASTVELNYSYKLVYYTYDDEDWYQRFQFNTLKFSGNQFNQIGSGLYNELGQTRVQLPAVILEIGGGESPVGYELGHNSQYMYRDILFNIVTENKWERDNLVSLIQYQNHKSLNLLDFNAMATQGKFPLNSEGSRVSGAMIYPDMVNPDNGLVWKGAYIMDSKVLNPGFTNYGFYMGLVKSRVEVIV